MKGVYADRSDTGAGPSWNIWCDCPWEDALTDPGVGFSFWDDFTNWAACTSATATLPYYSFLDTSCTGLATTYHGGAMNSYTTTTGNIEAWIQAGGGSTGAPFFIPGTTTTTPNQKLWFEARFYLGTVTTGVNNLFVGLAQIAAAANNFMADTTSSPTGAVAKLGMYTITGAPTALVGVQTPAAGTVTGAVSVGTVAATTWTKAGFTYDPQEPSAAKRVKFFFNGAETGTYLTQTNINTMASTAGVYLSPIWGHKSTATSAGTVTWDWVRCFQKRA